jgi:Holliday junction resolvase RusA-like endonuclease
MIQFRINEKPLSVNEAFKGRKFKTDKYQNFEKAMLLQMPKKIIGKNLMLRVDLFFGFSSSASDIDNCIKATIDIAQKKFFFDDKQIFELNVRKCIVKKGEEFIEMGIYPLLPFE